MSVGVSVHPHKPIAWVSVPAAGACRRHCVEMNLETLWSSPSLFDGAVTLFNPLAAQAGLALSASLFGGR